MPQLGVPGVVGVCLMGAAAIAHVADTGAADEAERAVVELVAVQIVHAHAAGARAHERIELRALATAR